MFKSGPPFRFNPRPSETAITIALILFPLIMVSYQNCAKVGVSEIVEPMLAPSPAKTCDPALSPRPCARDHGTGYQLCSWDGNSWGNCGLDKCDASYRLYRGECDFTGCTPNQEAACTGTNGFGTYVCNSTGTAFGTCNLNSCMNGFFLNSAVAPKRCDPWVCTPTPTAQTRDCTVSITNAAQARETCNSTGSAWGACTVVSCNAVSFQHQNACVLTNCIDAVTLQRVGIGSTGVVSRNRESYDCTGGSASNITLGCQQISGTCMNLGGGNSGWGSYQYTTINQSSGLSCNDETIYGSCP